MLQVIPTWQVEWCQATADATHVHEFSLRVPETDLQAVLNVLRFNGVVKFSAEREDVGF